MPQYSPELIRHTIAVFESRTGMVISEEDARQALENISGFFRVLQNWAKVEDKGSWDASSADPAMDERVAQ
jgi:hypothetical protein